MTDNYLLDAVDKLTQKHISRVQQTSPAGISCISDIDHEPLLKMLRDAIAAGTGGRNGSSTGSAFLPINPGAVEMWDGIVKQINTWHRALPDHREETLIWDRLRQWYVDFENRRRAGKTTDSEEHDATRLVEGWARNIEGMFDPPITLEITSHCPICGQRWAHDPRTGDQIGALVISYRNQGTETLDRAEGLCRFCETVWRGRTALRELRFELDAPESAIA